MEEINELQKDFNGYTAPQHLRKVPNIQNEEWFHGQGAVWREKSRDKSHKGKEILSLRTIFIQYSGSAAGTLVHRWCVINWLCPAFLLLGLKDPVSLGTPTGYDRWIWTFFSHSEDTHHLACNPPITRNLLPSFSLSLLPSTRRRQEPQALHDRREWKGRREGRHRETHLIQGRHDRLQPRVSRCLPGSLATLVTPRSCHLLPSLGSLAPSVLPSPPSRVVSEWGARNEGRHERRPGWRKGEKERVSRLIRSFRPLALSIRPAGPVQTVRNEPGHVASLSQLVGLLTPFVRRCPTRLFRSDVRSREWEGHGHRTKETDHTASFSFPWLRRDHSITLHGRSLPVSPCHP